MQSNLPLVCITFSYKHNFQKFLVQKQSKNSIGMELSKFICYLDDFKLFNYTKEEIENKKLSFDEFSCIMNLEKENFVKEIINEDFYFDVEYIVDFENNYLTYINRITKLSMTTSFPFETISSYPDSLEKCY